MKKLFKTTALIFFIFISLVTLGSCEGKGTELSELMIMQGIGIDSVDGGYNVCVEILNNEQSGSPGGDGTSENKTKIYSATGETVGQALHSLVTKSGNLPLYAHNRVVVIGEAAANENLADILDFFERDFDSRPSQLICVAKNEKAENIIRAKLLSDSIKSEILENTLEESYNQSLVPKVRIIDAINYLKDETTVICIPAVKIEKSGENENYELDGCALFGKDRSFSKYIDSVSASGIAFLSNDIKEGIIVAGLPNSRNATFLINKGKTDYDVSEENGKLHFKVRISLSCDLDEVEGEEFFNADNGVLRDLENAAGASICKTAENTAIVLKQENSGDAVRFGRVLRLKNPELYKKYKSNWEEAFKGCKISLSVDITLRRIGEETFHSNKK